MQTSDARPCIGATDSFAPQSRAHLTAPRAAPWYFPYSDHRTVAEVWEEQARLEILRSLGR